MKPTMQVPVPLLASLETPQYILAERIIMRLELREGWVRLGSNVFASRAKMLNARRSDRVSIVSHLIW